MLATVTPLVVPSAALFAVGLLALLAALLLILLRVVVVTVIGSLLSWIASALKVIPFVGGWSDAVVLDGVNAVDAALGKAIAASERVAVSGLLDAWKLLRWTADQTANLAIETLHGFDVVVTHAIPHAVSSAIGLIRPRVEQIETTVEHLDKTAVAGVRSDLAAVKASALTAEGRIAGELRTVDHSIATTLPRTIAAELGDVRGWTSKQLRRLTRRLSAVEEKLTLAALAGVIVGVIAREIPWVRCKNVGKVGKQLCGMPITQLEKLLADFAIASIAIFGTMSLEGLAVDEQKILAEVAKEVLHFWRADVKGVTRNPGLGDSGL